MFEMFYIGIFQFVMFWFGFQCGVVMGDFYIIEDVVLFVWGGVIQWVGFCVVVLIVIYVYDFGGWVVVLGFVDLYIYVVWVGDCLSDWEVKLQGVIYEEILVWGGGICLIMWVIVVVDVVELVVLVCFCFVLLWVLGVIIIEVKSGYGFDFDVELWMLWVVCEL